MSADNWTRCPTCEAKRQASIHTAEEEAVAAYGTVSVEEFDRLRDVSLAMKDAPVEDTLREDYSVGVNVAGQFSISYSCSCKVCGFEWTHNPPAVVACAATAIPLKTRRRSR
jgi:hypothetical protein